MKKLALMTVAAMITSLTFAQKLQEKDVPTPVKTAFQKQYPNTKEVKWDKEGEKFDPTTNISSTLDAIRMKFGDDSIMKLGEKPKVNINAIPTGSIGLDAALGVGGIPRGRIIEIFGPESSGKTTLSLHIIANTGSFPVPR